MLKKIISFIVVGLIIFLSGCGLSEVDVIGDIEEAVEISFSSESPEPNGDFVNFSIYFPDHLTVIEESESNLIFEDQDDQTYILFHNPLEGPSSQSFYNAQKEHDQHLLLESYHDLEEDRFGYVKIASVNESYELQVGVGGVRITTFTSLDDLEEDFNHLVTMMNSLSFHE